MGRHRSAEGAASILARIGILLCALQHHLPLVLVGSTST